MVHKHRAHLILPLRNVTQGLLRVWDADKWVLWLTVIEWSPRTGAWGIHAYAAQMVGRL